MLLDGDRGNPVGAVKKPRPYEDLSSQDSHESAGSAATKLNDEMRYAWVGPMPIEEFLESFLPSAPTPRSTTSHDTWLETWCSAGPNSGAPHSQSETNTKLIKAIKRSNLCPMLKFFDTHAATDQSAARCREIQPDLCVYNADDAGDVDEKDHAHWSTVAMWWKVQGSIRQADPWGSFLPTVEDRARMRGLHVLCNAKMFNRQHRNFAFSVAIMGDFARLVRWDRAGGIVSERFDYKETQHLGEFLWRFNHMSPAARGLDSTVTKASDAEIVLAKRFLSKFSSSKTPPLNIAIEDGRRHYIVWKPLGDPLSSIGRATRGYPAFELEATIANPHEVKLVFMKDVWRIDSEEWLPEGTILQELNDAKVRYVPDLLYHADVDPLGRGRTRTNEDTFAKHSSWASRNVPVLIPRIHYRMVTKFCGVPIYHFKESSELMIATHHAYKAHRDAFEKCEYIHRDVSADNVLIDWDKDGNPRGTLIDWEFARKIGDIQTERRQVTRAGTWQFMSCRLLQDPHKHHEIQDDMESFVHIVMCVGLRWIPHNRVNDLYSIFSYVYDAARPLKGGKMAGGSGKKELFNALDHIRPDFAFDGKGDMPHPMTAWVLKSIEVINKWLTYCSARESYPPKALDGYDWASVDNLTKTALVEDLPENPLKDHACMDLIWDIVLQRFYAKKCQWPRGDKVDDQLPTAHQLHHTEISVPHGRVRISGAHSNDPTS
ncbi:hypothetical protein PLICRDRAFT_54828 [Plicaturopsis crispa FD-325 SS-3]|nr:hypothetical protein PLICRDRAFT_54828 [Plicaturopsis crispa FD-325 SS-3]